MTYLHDNEKRKRRNKILALFIAVAFLFYFQHGIVSFLNRSLSGMFEPVLKNMSGFNNNLSSSVFGIFSSKHSLIDENNKLKLQIEESSAKMLDYNRLLTENLELKDLLGRVDKSKTVLASIIAKPNQSPYDVLILDIGEKNNIFVGATVLAYGNIIIGKISEVSATHSKATLFSSPGEEYDGMIMGNNISLKLFGRGGGNFSSELPRSIEIKEGDQVYSTGLNPYILGTVKNISSDPRDPFQTILLGSPVNISELRFVEVSI